MKAYERLIQYAKYNTQSAHDAATYPSTPGQKVLGEALCQELISLGVTNATMDEFGYVIGRIPGNDPTKKKTVALIAHMDTSPDASGKNVQPRIIYQYDGNDIVLNQELQMVLSPNVFPQLTRQIGDDLIVTDGTTLLGADDKAGVAEIMTFVEYMKDNPDYLHGEVVVVFTPDEEVGTGTEYLQMEKVKADFGFTLDGARVGEIAYENFNAAWAFLTFHGTSVHPGSAKNKMINAISLAMEFDQLLPKSMRPELTEGYEGFNHLTEIHGIVEEAKTKYIIRNHDRSVFESQKSDFERIVAFMNDKYHHEVVTLTLEDSYFNMREILDQYPEIIRIAKEAIEEVGLTPIIEPIRGGTDGARLTYMGLPCPNLGTGGYNYHGPYEYADIQEMEKSLEIIINLVTKI